MSILYVCRKFEVMYDDNNKCKMHSMLETEFIFVSDDEDDEDDEEDEEEEEVDMMDLPASCGWESGTVLEVLVFPAKKRSNSDVWWPATLGKRAAGKTDADGRQLYSITMDAFPEYGSHKERRVKVSFLDDEVLHDPDRGEFAWRFVDDTEDEESSEYGSDSEDEEDNLVSGMASMGVSYDAEGAPRKRALIVGCSYSGQSNALPGTINDAHAIYKLLVGCFNFPDDSGNIMYLTDDHHDSSRLPTRRNILKGFEWLMKDLHSGDSLFFYFTGHGGTQDDPSGSEPRGNQVICPCDYSTRGIITDTEIHKHLVTPLPPGVVLHALVDSCHSGTVMNLPHNADIKKGHFTGWSEEYPGQSWKRGTLGGLAIQISAAQHNQYAREGQMKGGRASSSGVRQGAATYGFTRAIKRHQKQWGFDVTYEELMETMYEVLRDSNFKKQDPQLSASMTMDLCRADVKFKL